MAHTLRSSTTKNPVRGLFIQARVRIREPAREGEGFPGSSAGKESTCNTGDPSSIPG